MLFKRLVFVVLNLFMMYLALQFLFTVDLGRLRLNDWGDILIYLFDNGGVSVAQSLRVIESLINLFEKIKIYIKLIEFPF